MVHRNIYIYTQAQNLNQQLSTARSWQDQAYLDVSIYIYNCVPQNTRCSLPDPDRIRHILIRLVAVWEGTSYWMIRLVAAVWEGTSYCVIQLVVPFSY